MRINKILVSALVMALSFYSCDYLDVPPINIIQDDAIFNSESGITSYMTTLYYDLPHRGLSLYTTRIQCIG